MIAWWFVLHSKAGEADPAAVPDGDWAFVWLVIAVAAGIVSSKAQSKAHKEAPRPRKAI